MTNQAQDLEAGEFETARQIAAAGFGKYTFMHLRTGKLGNVVAGSMAEALKAHTCYPDAFECVSFDSMATTHAGCDCEECQHWDREAELYALVHGTL